MNLEDLFEIKGESELPTLKPVARTIPYFRAIIEEDRGSKGDADGRKKLLAMKQLAYLYFTLSKRHFRNISEAGRDAEILRHLDLPLDFQPTESMIIAYNELKKSTVTITEKLLTNINNLLLSQVDLYGKIGERNEAILRSVENIKIIMDDGNIDKTALMTQKTALEELEANNAKITKMMIDLPKQLETVKDLNDKFVKELMNEKKTGGVVKTNKWENKQH